MANVRGTKRADFLLGTLSQDFISGNNGNDTIFGGGAEFAPTDLGDSIDGGRGNDSILGNGGNDTVLGGAGADFINAGAGNDLVFGDSGSDRIVLNDRDTVFGGADIDLFLIQGLRNATNGEILNARLNDWQFGERFDFGVIDANALVSGDQSFRFLGNFSGPVGVNAGELAVWTIAGGTNIQFSDGATLASIFIANGTFALSSNDFIL